LKDENECEKKKGNNNDCGGEPGDIRAPWAESWGRGLRWGGGQDWGDRFGLKGGLDAARGS